MTEPLHLVETVRVRRASAPLWRWHLSRLERSAATLGIRLDPIDAPGGRDRIVRISAGGDGTALEDRAVPASKAMAVAFSGVPHPGYPHKTDRREAFDAARAEAALDGADEALLSTGPGWVAEGSLSAVFWWDVDGLAAPPLALGILPSIARERIAELAGRIREIRIDPSSLRGRAIFLANAARGIMEVVSLQGESVPQDPRTAALAERFWP